MRAWTREGGILVHDEVGGVDRHFDVVGLVWISPIEEVFDDMPCGMVIWSCRDDERFDLRMTIRRNARGTPRNRSLRLRGYWVLKLMSICGKPMEANWFLGFLVKELRKL